MCIQHQLIKYISHKKYKIHFKTHDGCGKNKFNTNLLCTFPITNVNIHIKEVCGD